MDENNGQVRFFTGILINFGVSVITVSIMGYVMGDITKGVVGLLTLGKEGLSYSSLLQLFIFAVAVSMIRTLFLSNLIIKRMMLLWRAVLMLGSSYATGVAVAVLFKWFPLESMDAWLGFLVSFTACIAIGILLLIVKTKIDAKKYQVRLSDYKKKQEGGEY